MFHVEHPGPRAGRGRAPRRRRTPAARPGDVSVPLRLPLTIALNIPGASADPSVGAPGFSVCRPVACGTCRPPAGRSLLSLPARGLTLPAGGLGFSSCRQQEASYSRQAAPIFVPAARPELCAARLISRTVLPSALFSRPCRPPTRDIPSAPGRGRGLPRLPAIPPETAPACLPAMPAPTGGFGFCCAGPEKTSHPRQAAQAFVLAARPELCAARLAPRAVLPPAPFSRPCRPPTRDIPSAPGRGRGLPACRSPCPGLCPPVLSAGPHCAAAKKESRHCST